MRDCGKLIQSLKERGILQMSCFVILLLFNKMQMSLRRFSAIPHLRDTMSLQAVNSRSCGHYVLMYFKKAKGQTFQQFLNFANVHN